VSHHADFSKIRRLLAAHIHGESESWLVATAGQLLDEMENGPGTVKDPDTFVVDVRVAMTRARTIPSRSAERKLIKELVADVAIQQQLIRCITYSDGVIAEARSAISDICKNDRLGVSIVGSVARRTAVVGHSDADFVVLLDDRGLERRERSALIDEGRALVEAVAAWFSSRMSGIDVSRIKREMAKIDPLLTDSRLGKFPTLFTIESIITGMGEADEPQESSTRRLAVLTESEWLYNKRVLDECRKSVMMGFGLSMQMKDRQIPEAFLNENRTWLDRVRQRSLKGEYGAKAEYDGIKSAFRFISAYSAEIAILDEIGKDVPDINNVLERLSSAWITRLVLLLDSHQELRIRRHVGDLLRESGALLKLLSSDDLHRELANGNQPASYPKVGADYATNRSHAVRRISVELASMIREKVMKRLRLLGVPNA